MDDEAELDTRRRRLATKPSSIKRKPLANLTNIIHKPQSKKPASSTASDSSIGSTQNPIHLPRPIIIPSGQHLPSQPQRLTTDRLVGDDNCNSVGQRQNTRNNRSNTKDAVVFRQKYIEGTRNTGKEGSVSLCSSTLEKVKDQGKVNQSCLDKTKNDGKILYKRKAIDVPLSAHHTKNANNSINTPIPHSNFKTKDICLLKNLENSVDTPLPRSTVNIKVKGRENIVQSGHSLMGNANTDRGITMPNSLMNGNDKGKAIDVPLDYCSIRNVERNTGDAHFPLKGVMIKDSGDTTMGPSSVDLAQIDDGKSVVAPNFVMNIKDKGKAIAVPNDNLSMKYRKSNMGEDRVPLKGVIITDRGETATGSIHVDLAKKDGGKAVNTPTFVVNRKDKGKAIAVPDDYSTMKYRMSDMVEGHVPLKGVVIKDRGETVSGSSRVDPVQKDQGKAVTTPVNYRTLKKKDKRSSCPPLLRATSNRNDAVESEDIIQFKTQTEPPPNKKKRRCSSKEEYTLPQEYVEQQRAYFKEIDDFELEMEEV